MNNKKLSIKNIRSLGKSITTTAIGAILMGGSIAASAGELAEFYAAEADRAIPGQYIVLFKSEFTTASSKAESASLVSAMSYEIANNVGGQLVMQYNTSVKGMALKMDAAQLQALREDPRVALVEQDQIMEANDVQNDATWGLDRIDQTDLPLNDTYIYNYTASNVTAYIVDTGILSSHSDFNGRVESGYTAINDGRGTNDCNGHGTHVAGTVGSATWGVAKNVSLVPVRVLNCSGQGTNSGVIAGVDWVASNAQLPAVANMSLGGQNSTALDNAVRSAVAQGVTFVVAAGNDNANACSGSPNRVAEAITVAATTSSDSRSSFSNWGSCVDIFAPGSSITSTWSNGGTNTISGTSMASPHVAGAAALYLDQVPGATPAQVAAALMDSASLNKISNARGTPNRLLNTNVDGTPPSLEARISYDCDALSCTFDGSGSTGTINSYSWSFGDGDSGSGSTVNHTYDAEGTYTVTLTVFDDEGSDSTSVEVSVSDTPSPTIELSLSSGGFLFWTWVDLNWSGATGNSVDVYRDGSLLAEGADNDGAGRDYVSPGTYSYQVCESGSTTACSEEELISF